MHMKTAWLSWWVIGVGWFAAACSSNEAPSRFQSTGAAGSGIVPASTGAGGGGNGVTTGGIVSGSGTGGSGGGTMEDPKTCAEASTNRTYVGCDFWPTVTYNPVWSVFDFAVVVANAGGQPAEVKIERAGMQIGSTVTVQPDSLEKIYLPWVPELKGPDFDMCTSNGRPTGSVRVDKGAYHLTSTAPVIAWQFNPLEYKAQGGPSGKTWNCPAPPMLCNGNGKECLSVSNDASLLLPSSAMTSHYRFFGKSGSRGSGGAASRETAGAYAITATQDATTVDVYVAKERRTLPNPATTPSGIAPGGPIPATPQAGKVTFQMNAGDVIQLMGVQGPFYDDLDFDLSGSLLDANGKPVQVISLIPITDIPVPEMANNGYADHVEETVLPAEVIGKHYLVAPPTTPNMTTVGHYVRFYGNIDGTTLDYHGSQPAGAPTTLNAEQVVEIGPLNASFEVTGSQPFAIGSYMMGGQVQDPTPGADGSQGDPAFSQEVTVEQFRKRYIFLAPDDYNVAVADILVPDGAMVTLDGAPLTTAGQKIGSSTYSIVRQKLDPGAHQGTHVLVSTAPIGLQVVAFGHATGIYYPGGLNLTLISEPPPPPR
jgi:hypothetical protein